MRKTLILVVMALLLVQIGFSASITDEVSESVSSIGTKVWNVLKGIFNFFKEGVTGYVAYEGKVNTTTNRTYGEAPVSDGMVGYWKLNNNANDETANNNDGAVHGATPTTNCIFGTGNCAYDFDGSDDYIDVPDSASLNLPDEITVEVWINSTDLTLESDDTGFDIVVKYNLVADTFIYELLAYRLDSEGINHLGWSADDSWNNYCLYELTNLATDTWYHIAGTYDGSHQRLYVNGVEVNRTAQSGSMSTNSGNVTIGGKWDGYFKGVIDNVIIHNKSLTAAEINESYTRGVATTTTYKTTNLTIWDTTDSQPALINQTIYFYANYSGDGSAINDSVGACTINLTGAELNYNASTKLYEYNASHATPGAYDYTINCSSTTYDSINASDTVIITSTILTISNIDATRTNDTAEITWTTNLPANSSVDYGLTTAFGDSSSSSAFTKSHSIALTGLNNGTTYYYNVTSYNASFNYKVSGPYSFRTKRNNDPPSIYNKTATVLTANSVRISWNTTEPANGTIRYGKNSVNLTGAAYETDYETYTSIKVSGLDNYTTHYYKITACDADGDCETVGPYSFKTLQVTEIATALNVPGTEEGIRLPTITPHSLTETPFETTLTPGGRFFFTLNGATHEMKLLNVYSDSVIILFSSDTINATFNKGETKNIDIDEDGVEDIKVTIRDIVITKVTFVISKIPVPVVVRPEENVTEEAVEEVPAKMVGIEEVTLFDKLKFPLIILASLLVAAIVGLGGYYTYQRGVTVELKEAISPEEMEQIKKLPKPQLQVILDDVYSMIKGKKTDGEIKKHLEDVKLPKNVVEAILYEMRSDFNRLDRLVLYAKLQKVRGKPLGKIMDRLARAEWAEDIIKLLG